MAAVETRRKVGRPPNTSREQILQAARRLFADQGWAVTTNKHVADAVGVSTPALYHYFGSKLDMYLAVFDDALEVVEDRLLKPLASLDTFAEQFTLVLEQADKLNAEAPSLAPFFGSALVDAGRYPDVRDALATRGDMNGRIIAALVSTGVATGEVDPAHKKHVAAFLRTVLVGLTVGVSEDLRLHRAATDALELLLRGELLNVGARARRRRSA